MLKDPNDMSIDEIAKVLKVEMIECFGGPFDGTAVPTTNLDTKNRVEILCSDNESVAEYELQIRIDTETNEVKKVLIYVDTESRPGLDIMDFMTGDSDTED